MRNSDIIVLKAEEVGSLLANREHELIEIVQKAYETHAAGHSSLPHSTFLHFPNDSGSRIIALPACLGGDFNTTGVKWVSSFPGNLNYGIDRASAIIVLNSTTTGRPEAIIEGAIINAKRTASIAAIASRHLTQRNSDITLGLLGCGPINFEIARFELAVHPQIARIVAYDLIPERARHFKEKCLDVFEGVQVDVVTNVIDLLGVSTHVSLATTAAKPHINNLSHLAPGSTILNVSLRDLTPELILSCDNIVDDVDHVCRAQTSLHLTVQLTGNRDFIRCALADILRGEAPARRDKDSIAVFSPFGLGVLDLAVGQFVRNLALEQKCGVSINSFLPDSWNIGRIEENGWKANAL